MAILKSIYYCLTSTTINFVGFITCLLYSGLLKTPGAPLTYFNSWGKGGGGNLKDFFGSEISAKRDFLGL